jgi:hypothetical protein
MWGTRLVGGSDVGHPPLDGTSLRTRQPREAPSHPPKVIVCNGYPEIWGEWGIPPAHAAKNAS